MRAMKKDEKIVADCPVKNICVLASALENSPDPVAVLIKTGEIIYFNQAFDALIGRAKANIRNTLANIALQRVAIMASRQEVVVQCGARAFSFRFVFQPNGELVFAYGMDITASREKEEMLLQAVLHDQLTGLPNRVQFFDRVNRTLQRVKLGGEHDIAIMFLDLDNFKDVNDIYGHNMGDKTLKVAASKIARCIRPGDIVARLGGDEFAVLLDGVDNPSDAVRIAERIHCELSMPFHDSESQIITDASIGIAICSVNEIRNKNITAQEIIVQADEAMYAHKKNRIGSGAVIFDRQLHNKTIARLNLETELREAVRNNEFIVVYQPIVDVSSKQVNGFEALLRWNHPRRGLLSPAEFITVAEESRIIVKIGWQVIKEACRRIKLWQDRFSKPFSISVNLSMKQFREANIVSKIRDIIASAGAKPEHLKIEITESTVMENNSAIEKLTQLKELGIGLLIDDFGTVHSSLDRLRKIPFDIIKIDRSFISGVSSDQRVVEAILYLARAFKMKVVAEGVETSSQLSMITKLGCEFVQGHYFSPAVDPLKAEMMFERGFAI